MIFYVKADFDNGSFKAGDQITADQYDEIKDTPERYNVLVLPDDAQARLKMRDATPNKPVGSAPDPEDALVNSFDHGGRVPIYAGGEEAIGTIVNPSREERKKDMNLDAKLGDTDSTKSPSSSAVDMGKDHAPLSEPVAEKHEEDKPAVEA